jgi:hypothetical protein
MMESPEPVRRVAPPRAIMPSSMKQMRKSQTDTARRDRVAGTPLARPRAMARSKGMAAYTAITALRKHGQRMPASSP